MFNATAKSSKPPTGNPKAGVPPLLLLLLLYLPLRSVEIPHKVTKKMRTLKGEIQVEITQLQRAKEKTETEK